jgi:benzoylformate decarboxylase
VVAVVAVVSAAKMAMPVAVPAPNAIELALLRIQREVSPTLVVVPGGYDMPMIVVADQLGFRMIVARSEAGAAWIAAGLAWETQQPTVVIAITSPGVYGTIQALHYAWVSRVPLVFMSGESSLAGSVQAGDGVGGPSVTRVTAPLTAWSADVARPAELPGALLRAVRIAATSSRPVHLNVPVSIATAQVAP